MNKSREGRQVCAGRDTVKADRIRLHYCAAFYAAILATYMKGVEHIVSAGCCLRSQSPHRTMASQYLHSMRHYTAIY